jgi:hypothetical protein
MVYIRSIFGIALLASFAHALPMPQDSAIGLEVGVSSPNGTPITDTVELASYVCHHFIESQLNYLDRQTAAEAAAKTAANVYGAAPPAEPTQPAEYPQQPAQEYPPPQAEHTPSKEQEYPVYGSGSAPWNNAEQYNDCVNRMYLRLFT